MQEELEAAETRLKRKEQRHTEVLQIQREAVMLERNKHIDAMKETGKADAKTWVEGDDTVGVGLSGTHGSDGACSADWGFVGGLLLSGY